MFYGYARVSARDQSLARQLDALRSFGVDEKNVFSDKASGKDFERPAYRLLVARLAKGDVLAVKSIDRLGRNYAEILEEWRRITKRLGCSIVVLDMPLLDTRSAPSGLTGEFIADMMLQLLSYVAQIERDNIRSRQAEGIASARARGVRFGRPPKERPASYEEVKQRLLSGEVSRCAAAAELGIGETTLWRWIRSDSQMEAVQNVGV